MTAHFLISGIAISLGLFLALFFYSLARVPGWHHYRAFSPVALLTASYAAVELTAQNVGHSYGYWDDANLSLVLVLSFGPLWLRFDKQQQARRLSFLETAAALALLAGCAFCFIPSLIVREPVTTDGSWHALTRVSTATPSASLFVVLLLLVMGQLVIRCVFRAWQRRGSWLRVGGCLLTTVGVAEPTPLVEWHFVDSICFTAGVVLVAVELGTQIASNAQRLATLNGELRAGIAHRTRELGATREALMSTERHAALGRLAGGVGHEVNNPLSYVKGNLAYLQTQLHENSDVDPANEADAAIKDALHGAERIRIAVADLTSYARGAHVSGVARVSDAIHVAMRVVHPHCKFSMRMSAKVETTAAAAIEESSLVQVLVTLLLSASRASTGRHPLPLTSISARQDEGEIVIEVSSKEDGKSKAFFVSEACPEEDDIGLFLCRTGIEAAGGSVSVQSHREPGTTVQLRLKVSAEPPSEVPNAKSPKAGTP